MRRSLRTSVAYYPSSHRPSERPLAPLDSFPRRHIGPRPADIQDMLKVTGFPTLDALCDAVVPSKIRFRDVPQFDSLPMEGVGETEALAELAKIADRNQWRVKSYLGQGFYGSVTPPVVLRNMLQNPGWYTAYTPYQAEISQGRMEMLLNYQTLVCELTGMTMSNASLLDEATAAAEALSMCHALHKDAIDAYFVDQEVNPSTLAVVRSRAEPLGIQVHVGDATTFDFTKTLVCGALLQYPGTSGVVRSDMQSTIERIQSAGARAVVATDLLALTLLTPPGKMGADIAVGNSQRFGVPMGCGGPHAAFLAVKDSKTARRMPGRIMSVSKDRERGLPALRMALQTREQHIRRDKATSNICTAQALLANMAASYAIYHGPKGLVAIAERVHAMSEALRHALSRNVTGVKVDERLTFDTVVYRLHKQSAKKHLEHLEEAGYNVRALSGDTISIALDETTQVADLDAMLNAIKSSCDGSALKAPVDWAALPTPRLAANGANRDLRRSDIDTMLAHPTFNSYHSETEMMRYLFALQSKDLALNSAMIPLGSCTMKLNAASEMTPVTWPQFASLHPFAPAHQLKGTIAMADQLATMLASITGFDAVSMQPNSGAAGEYAGLRAIVSYHASKGQGHRDVCLIPTSAHGTNPASAVMAGLRVVPIRCLQDGYVDLQHLEEEAAANKDKLACVMITYPSTYGVFEETVRDIIAIVHRHGGQVYMDGANMNAQVGLTSPGFLGADVCHLNLHKTFCIPHGGGGPGVGPIGVKKHLAPFLPSHPMLDMPPASGAVGPMTSAPLGSTAILPIPWMYLKMMGSRGLRDATRMAILNANYMRVRLEKHYRVNYVSRGTNLCAHEFIIDISTWVPHGVHAEDVAKRLQDFGFHAPTMSWPVPETLMIEPTESESRQELDRFCDAMIHIRSEIQAVVDGKIAAKESPLHRAPHTLRDITEGGWNRPYTVEQAVYPLPWVRTHKFWPTVNRLDNVWGDRNLFCACDGFSKVAEMTYKKD